MEDKMIENHIHTMEHEIKLNGTTLKEIKKKIVNDVYDAIIDIDPEAGQSQAVVERTIEDQHGLRSFMSSLDDDGNSLTPSGQIYTNADGNPMAEGEIKQFKEDWENHWTPQMTEHDKKYILRLANDDSDDEDEIKQFKEDWKTPQMTADDRNSFFILDDDEDDSESDEEQTEQT